MSAGIGHNGGPSLDDQPLVAPKAPDVPWFDLDAARRNGKPRNPMERSTSRTALLSLTTEEKPLLGRRIWGRTDIPNSLNGGPLRRQKVTPYRLVPMKSRLVERLDHVANTNSTQRLPYLEEVKAGRLTEEQGATIRKGMAVKSSRPPQINDHLNAALQKARSGCEMKELAPQHMDIAVKRLAEAGRIVLRCAADAARATSSMQVYKLASAASDELLAMRKKARGGARANAGRKAKAENDNYYLIERRKIA